MRKKRQFKAGRCYHQGSRVAHRAFTFDGAKTYTYDYHVDGQLAYANYGNGKAEDFGWDGLALIKRGDERFVNEPHVGGGNPVASSKGTKYFNDILGTTVGAKTKGRKYTPAALTAFGERLDDAKGDSPAIRSLGEGWFTGKPEVAGLGHAFLFRNYRASIGKWQTVDSMGYPDGWNALAYCGNAVIGYVDPLGCYVKVVDEYDDPESETLNLIDKGWHTHSNEGLERSCHWYVVQTLVDHVIVGQNFEQKRRWESIDGLENILRGLGYGLEISAGWASLTGIVTIPATGIGLGGLVCHSAAEIVNALNEYIEVPTGEKFELIRKQTVKDSFELHVLE